MQDATTWYLQSTRIVNNESVEKAIAYQNTLTKPAGSLGYLETLATQFSGWQNTVEPKLNSIAIRVFAADHGICAQGVSAFPQSVTLQMIDNFVAGGAAISVLAKHINGNFAVVNMGTVSAPASSQDIVDCRIDNGTKDFSTEPAMTIAQCEQALAAGKAQVDELSTDLFIGGEMGIGNTTSASALYCAILKLTPKQAVGPGTGVDAAGMQRKIEVIERGLARHNKQLEMTKDLSSPLALAALASLGGFEIAALAGAYIACAQKGTPVLVDGFITTAAALIACSINPTVSDWLLFSHQSAEPAHNAALEYLGARPILNLGMRLGEGSGSAVAVPVIQTALVLHNEMATFSDAGVTSSRSK